jgi:hypothetical protein
LVSLSEGGCRLMAFSVDIRPVTRQVIRRADRTDKGTAKRMPAGAPLLASSTEKRSRERSPQAAGLADARERGFSARYGSSDLRG